MPLDPSPSPHSSTAPKARRVKPWKVLVGVSLGWKLVVLTLGAAVPRWVIGDGLDLIPVASHAYAEQAKVTAMGLWNHPLERFGIVRALRVTSVTSVTSPNGAAADSAAMARRLADRAATSTQAVPRHDSPRCNQRSATVVAYTYFAIPYSQVRTSCGSGVVEYRVFRRRS